MLPVILHSLAVQTYSDFEAIIADNSPTDTMQQLNRDCVAGLKDKRFWHLNTAAQGFTDCYSSAEWVVEYEAHGDWLCFPSDDSYYVPCFAETLIKAAEMNRWELVYCNMLYDARFNGQFYAPVNVQPMKNSIDKTGFLLKRNRFRTFPGKVLEGPCKADGELIESLLDEGIYHGKVPDFLMVHN
jgi:glycosyltransferase involved in cell wall biosynthesis